MMDIRNLVLDILTEHEEGREYLSDIVRDVQDKYAFLEERDRAFIKNLATGTVEKKLALDYLINSASSVTVSKMKKLIRQILRMACFEIFYMDHIPARASVNEAVRLSKKRHMAGLSGFVNAVARKLASLKEEGEPVFPDVKTGYSFPDELFSLLSEEFGKDITEKIMRSSDERRPLYLRANIQKCSVIRLREMLEKEGIKAENAPFGAYALQAQSFNVSASFAFKKGYYSVQDITSMSAIEAAGIKKGMNILDLCAAPGGKACFCAELMQDTGLVTACDISEERTGSVEENIERLGLKNVKTAVKDASLFDEEFEGSADLVIADLPCSGLGVMNRKVDIKYRIAKEDTDLLAARQRKILDNACRYVKKGGKLLYSTCTLTRKENGEQTARLEKEKGFKKLDERQYIQGIDPCDGFYYAVLQKG